jgi:hypothetical protein
MPGLRWTPVAIVSLLSVCVACVYGFVWDFVPHIWGG